MKQEVEDATVIGGATAAVIRAAIDEAPASYRFKVTTGEGRVFFAYGRDGATALGRVPAGVTVTAFEPAGHVDKEGRLHLPPEEVKTVMASMIEGREAPMK